MPELFSNILMEILEQTKHETSNDAEQVAVQQKEIPEKNKRRSEKNQKSKEGKTKFGIVFRWGGKR